MQPVRVPSTNKAAKAWETLKSDYPGRGWEHSIIPAGGSVQFPMSLPSEAEWRVCLLYSREVPGSQSPNRRFNGTYESVGLGVREDVLINGEPSASVVVDGVWSVDAQPMPARILRQMKGI